MTARDRWLRASEAELAQECDEERRRAGGPGGQHRQKNATVVRLRHRPTGLEVVAGESRSLAENRRRALRRLRLRIACSVRAPFERETFRWPPELRRYVEGGVVRVGPRNPDLPRLLAVALDALAWSEGSFARAAGALGLSTSQLVRLLQSEPEAWRVASAIRAARGSELD